MRWRGASSIAMAVVALAGCSSDGPFDGSVAAAAEKVEIEGVEDRWIVTVDADLGRNPLSGQEVQVAFDAEDLSCDDGRALDPGELEVGDRVAIDPAPSDGHDATDPVTIAASSLAVECEAS